MNLNITLKELSPEDRPREKMILKGKNSLSDSELLAIIIGSGSRKKTALDLSREILMYCNNDIGQLTDITYFDLIKFNGVGEAKAVSILAALELSQRWMSTSSVDKIKVKQSNDVYQFLKRDFNGLKHEECYVVLLNLSLIHI